MNVPGCRSRSLWQPLLLLVLDEDGDEHTALEIASATADETVMTVLVSHVFKMHLSAATEESDEHYRDIKPPPYFAAMHSVFICRLLAHADHEGRTALHIAASEGRFHACRFFAIHALSRHRDSLARASHPPTA